MRIINSGTWNFQEINGKIVYQKTRSNKNEHGYFGSYGEVFGEHLDRFSGINKAESIKRRVGICV